MSRQESRGRCQGWNIFDLETSFELAHAALSATRVTWQPYDFHGCGSRPVGLQLERKRACISALWSKLSEYME